MITMLFLSHDSQVGGAEVVLYNLISRLDFVQFKAFLWMEKGGVMWNRAKSLGTIRMLPARTSSFRKLRSCFLALISLVGETIRLSNLCSFEKIDVLYANTFRSALYAALISLITRKPLVFHHHHSMPNSWIFRLVVRRAKVVVTNSKFLKNELVGYGISSAKIEVVYNGLSIAPHESRMIDKQKPLTLMCIGKVIPAKNQLDFVKVVQQLSRSIVCRGIIVGQVADESYAGEVRGFAHAHQIDIEWIGATTQIEKYYELADIVVSTSLAEAFGLTIAEAFLYGRPAFTYPVGGIPELFEESERERFLAATNSVEHLVPLINEYLNVQNIEIQSKFIIDKFNLEDQVDAVQSILKSLSLHNTDTPILNSSLPR